MKKKQKSFLFSSLIGFSLGLLFAFVSLNPIATSAKADEPIDLSQYYTTRTLNKDGNAANGSVTYSGIVPYGSDTLSLGTYDLSTFDLSKPFFEVLPQKAWLSSKDTGNLEDMFFSVDLKTSTGKTRTIRFAKDTRTDADRASIFIGTSDANAKAAYNQNIWMADRTDLVLSNLPYRYDGSPSDAACIDSEGNTINQPTPVGIYYSRYFYMDQVVSNYAEKKKTEVETGTEIYRYGISVNIDNPLSAADLKSVEMVVRFAEGKAPATKEDSWVMFTSIGGNDFKSAVKYNTADGTITSENYTTEYNISDTSIQNLPTATKVNYEFDYWSYGDNINNKVNDENFASWLKMQTGDITLNAIYKSKKYNVTYNLNYTNAPTMTGGKVTIDDWAFYSLEQIAFENYPSGKIFDGWYTQATGGEKITALTQLGDVTLYAHWIDGNLVVFNYENDKVIVPVKAGESITQPTVPEKFGYEFDGWFNGETKYTFGETVTSALNLTIKYTPKSYSLKFYVEGELKATLTKNYDEAIGELPTIPAKENTVGSAWYCGNKEVVSATKTSEVITKQTENNVSIIAVYQSKSFVVTFDYLFDGKTVEQTIEFGDTVKSNVLVEREGYEFIAWQYNGVNFDLSTPIKQDYTLKALWKQKEYTVTVVQNGTEIGNITKKHGETISKEEIATLVDSNDISKVYSDGSLLTEFAFNQPIKGNTKIYLPMPTAEVVEEENMSCSSQLNIQSMGGVLITSTAILAAFRLRKRGKKNEEN